MEDNLKDALDKIANMYISKLKENMISDGTVASRELINGITYRLKENGFEILSAKYLGTVSEGKKATNKNPSKEMVSKVADWMQMKNMTPRGYRGRFQKHTRSNYLRAAYGISKRINENRTKNKYRWQGSDVIDRSFKQLEGNIDSLMVEALKSSIDEALQGFNK